MRNTIEICSEITRHKLPKNQLPLEMVYQAGELNALDAAFTTLLCTSDQERTMQIGDEAEGVIILPKKAVNTQAAQHK